MQQEHKLLSDDLTHRLNDLHTLERKRTELEKELYELRPLKQKLQDIEFQVEEVLQKKSKSDSEINRL